MSDPSLVQITFKIKPDMPKDMKRFILYLATDYYDKYYKDKEPSHEEYLELMDKYLVIRDLIRNDSYHNVDFQYCKLSKYDLYDLDTLEILHDNGHWLDENDNEIPNNTPDIGVCITSLPRRPETLDEFLKLVGPYITSEVCTLGIQHFYDYGKTVAYYYIDKQGHIRKQMIEQKDDDEILSTAINKKYSDEEDDLD